MRTDRNVRPDTLSGFGIVFLFVREYGVPLGLVFQGIRIKARKNIWATCGRDGTYMKYLFSDNDNYPEK